MAYTKYSLTPSSNTAAPPDGAPEGMLPSAVNDTMRDMMSQIRDCGDGIRGGTYTMTAPVITGGSINGTTTITTSGAISYTGTLTGGTGVVNLGSGQFYKDASGNIGVGTASPAQRLDVQAAACIGKFTSTTGTNAVFTQMVNTGGSFFLGTDDSTGATSGAAYGRFVYGTGAYPMIFFTNSAERMRIDSSGNIGIGTSSPSSYGILTTAGTINNLATALGTADAATVSILNNSVGGLGTRASLSMNIANIGKSVIAGYYAAFNGSNDIGTGLQFGTQTNAAGGVVERMRIDQNGNVGIGTSSPSTQLQVTKAAAGDSFSWTNGGATPKAGYLYSDANIAAIFNTAGAGAGRVGMQMATGVLSFDTAATERMRIDSSGILCVGSTSNTWAVAGAIKTVGITSHAGQSGAYQNNGFNLQWNGSAPRLWVDTTDLGTITTVSDYRIKRNIETQTIPALERVMALRPVTYQMADYKDGLFRASDDIKEGFIAHEVQEIIPSGAEGIKDDETQIQSLRLDAIISVAVKAIQEQQAMIENLTTRLNALEGK